MNDKFNRFCVCLLDVLGFESRLATLGLARMMEKYLQLIEAANERNAATERWFGPLKFSEGAYWTAEPDAFVSARLYGTYASDSILLFAHADFPENRYPKAFELTDEERRKRAEDPAQGWMYHPVPCDNFLDLCNEVICRSVEIGLPLRGAITLGEAVLHLDRGIYLGAPLVEAARLEKEQRFIGASFGRSFMSQVVPKRYQFAHSAHLKSSPPESFSGLVLDWPRHWRRTRTTDLTAAVELLDVDHRHRTYYEGTLASVGASSRLDSQYEAPDDTYLTRVYPQFRNLEQLQLHSRPVALQFRPSGSNDA